MEEERKGVKGKILLAGIIAAVCCGCSQVKKEETIPRVEHQVEKAEQATPQPKKKSVKTTQLSNIKNGWGLKKVEGAEPEIPSDAKEMLEKFNGYYMGDPNKKELFLTFDEGYENGYTAQILDVLKENNVPACFFITGPYLETEQELVRRMVEEGHEVGNHTVNHPSMPEVKDDMELEREMLELDKKFQALTGESMQFMRPPMGEYSERTLALTANMGYKSVFWSFAYVDWNVNQQRGAAYAHDEVMKYLHPGAILLLHAVSVDNANALDAIIKDAKAQGYEFKPLSELPANPYWD